MNAIKLAAKLLNQRAINPELIHRPRRAKVLPNVLSKEEVKSILEAPVNWKHRAMLSLIYACGLRRSELLNLKLGDIHRVRNLLHIRGAKGKKDRMVPLSTKLLDFLTDYYKAYRTQEYLFEGQRGEFGPSAKASLREGRHHKAGEPALAQAFLCHPPVGKRYRPALYSGTFGPQQQSNHRNLHAREHQKHSADTKSV